MKKLDNQGFMLIETLICATFIVGILIFVYIQFTNINRSYEDSFTYNTINDLYLADQARSYLKQENLLNLDQINDTNKYVEIDFCPNNDAYCTSLYEKLLIKKIILANHDFYNDVDSSNLDEEFKEFIRKVKLVDEGYSMYVQFNDGTYAVLKVEG